jgi:hypothetical protein
MNARVHPEFKVAPTRTPARPAGKKRQCACGGGVRLQGECSECRRQRQTMHSHMGTDYDTTNTSARTAAVSGLAIGHRFANLRVYPQGLIGNRLAPRPQHDLAAPLFTMNGAIDDMVAAEEPDGEQPDPATLPGLAGMLPADQGESVPGAEPLDTGDKVKVTCPSKTVVEKTVDMTPDGIKKGYRTGYGALAVMRVEPDTTNWDGTKIVESFKSIKNNCPEEFKISPCSGTSTFTVGAAGKSSVLGDQPATRNRFYDFHITRWNKGSLLHDRNPAGLESCQAECEQQYSCGGKVIGKHTVIRTFTKGKSGSRDVTLVNVTKT